MSIVHYKSNASIEQSREALTSSNQQIDEAIKLQQVIKKGFISLVVAGRNKRDRIVACEYANYFFHLKELEMIKKQQQTEYDISDWQLWGKTD